jgi:hypothetical protein
MTIAREKGDIKPLVQLATKLDDFTLSKYLRMIFNHNTPETQAQIIFQLAPQITNRSHQASLQLCYKTALNLNPNVEQVQALAALAPQLPTEQKQQALNRALEIALSTPERTYGVSDVAFFNQDPRQSRITVNLKTLVPLLNPPQLERVLNAVLAMQDAGSRQSILVMLLPYLDETASIRAMDKILPAIIATPEDEPDYMGLRQNRAQGLVEIAPYLQGEWLEKVLTATLNLESPTERSAVLSALAAERSNWVQVNQKRLRPALVNLLADLAQEDRATYLRNVSELLPLWQPLASPTTIERITRYIIQLN